MTRKESTECHKDRLELVFVYNADSGLFNALSDALHKLVSPHTYPCNLCALTYSSVRMRPAWREFVEGLELPARFLHADELKRDYGAVEGPLPAIFLDQLGELKPWLGKAEIDECENLGELEQLIATKLAADRSTERAA